MARAVGEGLTAGGAVAKLFRLDGADRSDVATELLDAGALLVGSPTLNNEIYPTLADTLTYLKGLRPKGLVGATFGSFGWGGQAAKILEGFLDEMGVERISEPVRSKYVPDADALKSCYELGLKTARRIV